MPEQYGIENTKALLVGANEVTIELMKVLKKGGGVAAEVTQLVADLSTNADLMAKLKAAAAAFPNEGDELKDLSLAEGMQLAVVQAQYVPKLLEAVHS